MVLERLARQQARRNATNAKTVAPVDEEEVTLSAASSSSPFEPAPVETKKKKKKTTTTSVSPKAKQLGDKKAKKKASAVTNSGPKERKAAAEKAAQQPVVKAAKTVSSVNVDLTVDEVREAFIALGKCIRRRAPTTSLALSGALTTKEKIKFDVPDVLAQRLVKHVFDAKRLANSASSEPVKVNATGGLSSRVTWCSQGDLVSLIGGHTPLPTPREDNVVRELVRLAAIRTPGERSRAVIRLQDERFALTHQTRDKPGTNRAEVRTMVTPLDLHMCTYLAVDGEHEAYARMQPPLRLSLNTTTGHLSCSVTCDVVTGPLVTDAQRLADVAEVLRRFESGSK